MNISEAIDGLFPTSGFGLTNAACLGRHGAGLGPEDSELLDLWVFAQSNFDQAKILLESITEDGAIPDVCIYGVMFSLHHGIECVLKLIQVDLHDIETAEGHAPVAKSKHDHHHKLADLWSNIRPRIEHRGVLSDDDLYSVGRCVDVLSAVSPDGTAWRYPTDKKQVELLANVPFVDLNRLMAIADFLEERLLASASNISGAMSGRIT